MKKQKNRVISLKAKILIPVVILLSSITLTLTLYARSAMNSKMSAIGGEAAGVAAEVTAAQLSKFNFDSIKSEDSKEYKAVAKVLSDIKKHCNIGYIYTLYVENDVIYYGVNPTTGENHSPYASKFEGDYQSNKAAFEGKSLVDDYISTVDGEKLITALVPVYDEEGNQISVVGCDFRAEVISNMISDSIAKTAIIGFVVTFLGLVIIVILISLIFKNLFTVNRKIYDLANTDGDLTQMLQVKSGDELEHIAENVNNLVSFIRKIITNIAYCSTNLHSNSTQMVKSVVNVNDNISNISATMEEMSAGMEEISASLHVINSNIEMTNSQVQDVASLAKEGQNESSLAIERANKTYQHAMSQLENVQITSEEMSKSVNEKIEQSKQVQKINDLTNEILNISSQTNLLALNASIEAARAGDAGKGFAVVADEIGKLASNSAEAAGEIQNVAKHIIELVSQLANESNIMINYIDKTTISGYENLLETSESYRLDIEKSNQKMEQFFDSCEDLASAMNGVTDSVKAINTAIEESVEGITATATSASKLASEADIVNDEANNVMNIVDSLQGEVDKFKI